MTAINARSRSWAIGRWFGWFFLLGISVAIPGAACLLGDNAGEELLGLVSGKHGRLALLDDVLGTAYRAGRVEIHDAAAGQPVEAHADGGQVLLDRWGGAGLGQLLDIGSDVHRLDAGERQAVPLAPGEEIPDGSGVCLAGVGVADGRGQEFDEAFACLLPGIGNDGGQDRPGGGCRHSAVRSVGQLVRHGCPPAGAMAAARAGGRIAAVFPSQRWHLRSGQTMAWNGLLR